MTLTPAAKKLAHLAIVGFLSGALAYISALAVGAPFPGWRALLLGVLMSGVTRASGSILAKIETKEPESAHDPAPTP